MNKRKLYRVAGVVFGIELPEDADVWSQMTNYDPFEVDDPECQPVFLVKYCKALPSKKKQFIPIPDAENPLEPKIQLYYTDDREMIFEMSPTWRSPMIGTLMLSPDFSQGLLDSTNLFAINNAMMLTYAMKTMNMGILEMHSSVVVNDGIGYMFLGVSGTGKSTHSRLWMENIDGTWLLNDDNPVIRVLPDGVKVFGTPWSGKTPCYKNESATIGAIVSLHQAPYNKITRQKVLEAYASIISSCSGIKFESKYVDMLHETLSKVISETPCFTLDCLPDGDAARLCHSTVARKK